MPSTSLTIEGPYNFDRVLQRLALDPLHCVYPDTRSVHVPIQLKLNNNSSKKQLVTVQATGTTNHPAFTLTSENLSDEVIARVRTLFQWDKPLSPIHHHFQQTDLAPIFTEYLGTPLVLDFDPYNCLLKCIIHQQLNLRFAHTLTQRFVTTYGEAIDEVYFYGIYLRLFLADWG